jgi:hypothetical protein
VRTIVNLADDVVAAVKRACRERSISPTEAVNDLIRAGLVNQRSGKPFRQMTHDLGLGIDYASVADAVAFLDGPAIP